ncbi:MAG: CBS domain-containing protein [Gammaproteobacteria bacterium]
MLSSATVRQYMSTSIITFTPDMEILDASRLLVKHAISGGPVLDEQQRVVGMLTEADLIKTTLQAGYYGEPGGQVFEFMSNNVKAVAPDNSILDLAEIFLDSPHRRFPVIDAGQLVGVISRRDVLRALLDLA